MASVRNPPTLHILTFTIFTQLENNAPFLSLKILHNHCLEFSWNECCTQEKMETMVMKNWEGVGVNQGAL